MYRIYYVKISSKEDKVKLDVGTGTNLADVFVIVNKWQRDNMPNFYPEWEYYVPSNVAPNIHYIDFGKYLEFFELEEI